MNNLDKLKLAKMIDHTLLKPDAKKDEIIKLCEEAKEYHFATVCVNPYWVPVVAEQLKGTDIGITTVVGFPLGANTTEIKVLETKNVIANGATEIDMVMNIGALKTRELETIKNDIASVVHAAEGITVKVIIETCLLTDEEKVEACILSKEAGAHFVKTSTGFSTGGATEADIRLMRKTVGEAVGVKASGGVRSLEDALTMIHAGANRIGSSSSVKIVNSLT